MSKVLISFLGTGAQNKDKAKNDRTYQKANYKFENGDLIENTSFVADALVKHYKIEKVILVGTVKSMWERVYEVFCDNKGIEPDLEYYSSLANCCDNANNESELVIPNKKKLEAAIGTDAHIELIRYGLNKYELDENAKIILGLEKYIEQNDELIVDITHSFRSLPLYLMNLLIYLNNVSQKHISITHITYGMLDISRDLGYTPVVELNNILEINQWITGAYAFKEFGKGYQIAKLLGYDENDSSKKNPEGKVIKEFSDVMGMDFLYGIKKQANSLSGIKNKEYGPIAQILIPQVIDDICKKFNILDNDKYCDSKKQLIVAKWHFEHMNYSSAIIDILESLISKIIEICDINEKRDNDNSELAKVILGKSDKKNKYDVEQYQFKVDEYLSTKKYSDKDIVDFLNKILETIDKNLRSSKDQNLKNELNRIKPQIDPTNKNAFSLVYSINAFRNAIAHQQEISFCSINDIIKMTKLCIDLLGCLI